MIDIQDLTRRLAGQTLRFGGVLNALGPTDPAELWDTLLELAWAGVVIFHNDIQPDVEISKSECTKTQSVVFSEKYAENGVLPEGRNGMLITPPIVEIRDGESKKPQSVVFSEKYAKSRVFPETKNGIPVTPPDVEISDSETQKSQSVVFFDKKRVKIEFPDPPKSFGEGFSSRQARSARGEVLTLSTQVNLQSTKEKQNYSGIVQGVWGGNQPSAASSPSEYPETVEEVIEAAKKIGYLMSLREGAKFLAYGAFNWTDMSGRKIQNWRKLLVVWRSKQTPYSRHRALEENKLREAGLDPWILPEDEESAEYEFYRDGQNRLHRRPKGDDRAVWEYIPTEEEIIQ